MRRESVGVEAYGLTPPAAAPPADDADGGSAPTFGSAGISIVGIGAPCGPATGTNSQCQLAIDTGGSLPLPSLTKPALRCVPTQYNVVGTTAFPKKSSYRCASAPTLLNAPLQCEPTQISAAGVPVASSYQCVSEVSAASAAVSSSNGMTILSLGSSCGPSYGGSNQCQLSMGVSGSLPSPTITSPPLQCVPTRFTLGATPSGSQYKCATALTGEIGPGVYPSEK